jgi:hypothetical protein
MLPEEWMSRTRPRTREEIMNKACDICKAVGSSKKAKICMQVIGARGSAILYLCKSCTKYFDDPLCNNNSSESLDDVNNGGH